MCTIGYYRSCLAPGPHVWHRCHSLKKALWTSDGLHIAPVSAPHSQRRLGSPGCPGELCNPCLPCDHICHQTFLQWCLSPFGVWVSVYMKILSNIFVSNRATKLLHGPFFHIQLPTISRWSSLNCLRSNSCKACCWIISTESRSKIMMTFGSTIRTSPTIVRGSCKLGREIQLKLPCYAKLPAVW